MGADRPDIDYEAAWRRELGEPSTKPAGVLWTQRTCQEAGGPSRLKPVALVALHDLHGVLPVLQAGLPAFPSVLTWSLFVMLWRQTRRACCR